MERVIPLILGGGFGRGDELEDPRHEEGDGGVGVEAVASLELSQMRVMGDELLPAVDHIIMAAEETLHEVGRVGCPGRYGVLFVELSILEAAVFLYQAVGDLEILQTVEAWVMEREARAYLRLEVPAHMEGWVDEDTVVTMEHAGEHSPH